jgi:nucleotide-binding universal stress UspA family protein
LPWTAANPRSARSEAIQLAKLSRCKLTAVYVLDQSALFTFAGADDRHLLTEAARQVGVTLALCQMRKPNVTGDPELVEMQGIAEDVASTLMRCAQRRGADLGVLLTHERRDFRRMVIGSVTERFRR